MFIVNLAKNFNLPPETHHVSELYQLCDQKELNVEHLLQLLKQHFIPPPTNVKVGESLQHLPAYILLNCFTPSNLEFVSNNLSLFGSCCSVEELIQTTSPFFHLYSINSLCFFNLLKTFPSLLLSLTIETHGHTLENKVHFSLDQIKELVNLVPEKECSFSHYLNIFKLYTPSEELLQTEESKDIYLEISKLSDLMKQFFKKIPNCTPPKQTKKRKSNPDSFSETTEIKEEPSKKLLNKRNSSKLINSLKKETLSLIFQKHFSSKWLVSDLFFNYRKFSLHNSDTTKEQLTLLEVAKLSRREINYYVEHLSLIESDPDGHLERLIELLELSQFNSDPQKSSLFEYLVVVFISLNNDNIKFLKFVFTDPNLEYVEREMLNLFFYDFVRNTDYITDHSFLVKPEETIFNPRLTHLQYVRDHWEKFHFEINSIKELFVLWDLFGNTNLKDLSTYSLEFVQFLHNLSISPFFETSQSRFSFWNVLANIKSPSFLSFIVENEIVKPIKVSSLTDSLFLSLIKCLLKNNTLHFLPQIVNTVQVQDQKQFRVLFEIHFRSYYSSNIFDRLLALFKPPTQPQLKQSANFVPLNPFLNSIPRSPPKQQTFFIKPPISFKQQPTTVPSLEPAKKRSKHVPPSPSDLLKLIFPSKN